MRGGDEGKGKWRKWEGEIVEGYNKTWEGMEREYAAVASWRIGSTRVGHRLGPSMGWVGLGGDLTA